MRTLFILLGKELRSFFQTPFGWVVIAFVMFLQGVSLTTALKGFRDAPIKESLVWVSFNNLNFWFYFLFIFPLITMRSFAEEEKTGTLEGLLTAPVKTWHIVASKYSAALIFYIVIWIPSALHWPIFAAVTDVPLPWTSGNIIGTYTILLLIGCLFIAIGCLASSLTKNQIVAGVVTIGLLLIHFFLGNITNIWGDFKAAPIFDYISSIQHLTTFCRGLLDSRAFVYYLTMTVFVLLLTHHVVDYRRWKA